MNISINNITATGLNIEFEEIINISEDYNAENNQASVKFSGRIYPARDGKFELSGELYVFARLSCDRCLEPADKHFNSDVKEIFSKDSDDEEIWQVNEGSIDIYEALESNVYSLMPMKSVCKSDCKGLCPICGKNLNEGDCGCQTPTDPRFDILSSFFDSEEV